MTLPELAPEPTLEQFGQIVEVVDASGRLLSTRQLTGGISCRMDVVSFEDHTKQPREFVVRQYGPWHKNDDPHPAVTEATILKHLARYDIAAPTLLLIDESSEIMGTPTIITSLIEGSPLVQPSDTEPWARQLVDAIVPVHETVLTASIRDLVPSLYTAMDRLFSRDEPTEQIAGHELGPELWTKLKGIWPSVDKSGDQLIHADYWPGNTLWKNGQLVAIVDWEEPRIGEPTWDIAVAVQDAAIFGMDIEATVLEHHEKVSDRPLRDYEFWRMYVALSEMPDPGQWVDGYRGLGGGNITADEVRANLTDTIEKMLAF